MSFQWTCVAAYLYFEIAVVTILMLPIASPRRWHRFFKSYLFVTYLQHAAWYFYIFLGILSLFLLDAMMDMRKYSHSSNDISYVHLASEMKGNVKMFRAQRNFYITGFAIFLAFVIRRLVNMIIIQAQLLEKAEKITKQAVAANELARKTVIKQTMDASEISENYDEIKKQLEMVENLLKEEKTRALWLEQESKKWRVKYEDASGGNTATGKGDE